MLREDVCRCCWSENLLTYLDLGEQPLANSYHKGETLPTYPLEVQLCEKCFHSQLSVVVSPKTMFQNYLYVSGTTHTFRKHCEDLAIDALLRCDKYRIVSEIFKQPKVLDIACNDGTLLEAFRNSGCLVHGVDPAENLRSITIGKNIPVEVAYWNQSVVDVLNTKFDIITATNVFAHVNQVFDFLICCEKSLTHNGILILEFPYCEQLISYCEFDTVYHEHLSYFLMNSFKELVDRTSFYVADVLRTEIHGGSIRLFLRKGREKHCSGFTDLIRQEKTTGLLEKATYLEFAIKVARNRQRMQSLVRDLQASGRNVIGYGASAKGNTMLNYFQLNLDYIVDDNSMKWGFLTPGRNIPIKSPDTMKNEDELYIVILAWNFYDEIVQKIETITGKKHHYIRYVPEVCLL